MSLPASGIAFHGALTARGGKGPISPPTLTNPVRPHLPSDPGRTRYLTSLEKSLEPVDSDVDGLERPV